MLHTLRMDRDIPLDRRVELVLPDDFPTGEAELVLVVVPKRGSKILSFGAIPTPEDDFIARRREVWLGHDE